MCGENENCQCPEELKKRPGDCTPEQIRKCHGTKRKHPCEQKAGSHLTRSERPIPKPRSGNKSAGH